MTRCLTERRSPRPVTGGSPNGRPPGATTPGSRSSVRSIPGYTAMRPPAALGEDVADDIVSETMTRAIANIAKFRPTDAGMDPWLFGIARHVAADHHRQANRRRTAADSIATPPGAGPAELVWTRDEHATLRAEFDQLPAVDRELLELRCRGGAVGRTTSPRSSASDPAPCAPPSRGPWVACAPGWPAVREVGRERRRAAVPTSGCACCPTRPCGRRNGPHRHAWCNRRGDVPGPSRADAATARPRLFSIVVAACGVAAVTLGLLATTTSFSRAVREAAHDVGLPVDYRPHRRPSPARRARQSNTTILVQSQPHWHACKPFSPGSTTMSWPRSSLASSELIARAEAVLTPPPSNVGDVDVDHLDHRGGDHRADRRRGASTASSRRRSPRHRHRRHADRFQRPRPTTTAAPGRWRLARRSGSGRPGR